MNTIQTELWPIEERAGCIGRRWGEGWFIIPHYHSPNYKVIFQFQAKKNFFFFFFLIMAVVISSLVNYEKKLHTYWSQTCSYMLKLLKILNLSLIVKFHHSSCRLLLLKNVTFENLIFQSQFKSDFLCFTEKSRSALIFNFSYFKPFHQLKKLRCHEY